MIEQLFGGRTAERVLLYLAEYGDGYASGIARTFGLPVHMVQRQLQRFERAGVLKSGLTGRTRVYRWNPRNLFVADLRSLLAKALDALPPGERAALEDERRRPRRAGKP